MLRRILFIAVLFGLISCEQQDPIKTEQQESGEQEPMPEEQEPEQEVPHFEDISGPGIIIEDVYKPTYETSQLLEKLEDAYINASVEDLDRFFAEWNETIIQNADDFINQNDTIKSVFDVYKEFYTPFDLKRLGDWEWGNMNKGYEYAVIQNDIYYFVSKKNNIEGLFVNWEQYNKVINFRPPVYSDFSKVLYFTDEYSNTLNSFLGTEMTGLGEGGIMSTPLPEGESAKRHQFLGQNILIIPGHWGGYWHFETHPRVSDIIFNNTLDKACISFQVGYMGGEAMFSKNEGKWVLESSKATWIQ